MTRSALIRAGSQEKYAELEAADEFKFDLNGEEESDDSSGSSGSDTDDSSGSSSGSGSDSSDDSESEDEDEYSGKHQLFSTVPSPWHLRMPILTGSCCQPRRMKRKKKWSRRSPS